MKPMNMRQARTGLLALVVLTAACGGAPGDPVGPNPPPPPPPPPLPPTTTVLDRAPIPASGGTVTVNRPGSPLHGLSVKVQSGAFPSPTQWTVVEGGTLGRSLPTGLTQVGSTFTIRNAQAYASRPFAITIPVPTATRNNTVAFYYDRASNTFELIPLLGTNDVGIVVATRHVSADQLLVPGPSSGVLLPGASVATASLRTFGETEIVLVEVSENLLATPLATTFVPGVHDWEFANRGSGLEPQGICTGMTLTALYRHYTEGGAKLFGTYDKFPSVWQDNPGGIRLASVVQHTMDWPAVQKEIATIEQAAGFSGLGLPRTQILSLAASIKLTGLPQQLAIYDRSGDLGHAIIAYGLTSDAMLVSDPNHPGTGRTMQHTGNAWVPFPFQLNAEASSEDFVSAFVIGATAYLPMSTIAQRWGELTAETIGDGMFPEVTIEYLDPVDTLKTWHAMPATIITASDSVVIRGRCTTRCEASILRPAEYGNVRMWSAAGAPLGASNDNFMNGRGVMVPAGESQFSIATSVARSAGPGMEMVGLVDYDTYTLKRVELDLSASATEIEEDEDVTFTLTHGGLLRAGTELRWHFGDDSAVVKTGTTPTAKHTFETSGTFTVRAEIHSTTGGLLGVDSVTITVGTEWAWVGTATYTMVSTSPGNAKTIRAEATGVRFEQLQTGVGYAKYAPVAGTLRVWNEVPCASYVSPLVEVTLGEASPDPQLIWMTVSTTDPGGSSAEGNWYRVNAYRPGFVIMSKACATVADPNPAEYAYQHGVIWMNTTHSSSPNQWTSMADPNLMEGSFTRVEAGPEVTHTWTWRFERVPAGQ